MRIILYGLGSRNSWPRCLLSPTHLALALRCANDHPTCVVKLRNSNTEVSSASWYMTWNSNMGSYAKKTVFWASSFQSSSERGLGPRSASFSLSIVGMLQGKIDIDRKSFVVDRSRTEKGNIFGRNKKAPIRNQSLPGAKEVQVQEEGIKPSAATGHKNRFQMLNCYDVTAACSSRNTILLQETHLYACCFVTKHHF